MNARVLELLKNPVNIQSEDLKLLENEIKLKPYIQNIRALYLYGTHQFNPENYQKELSKTAAYTTDKKILYHFINKNSTDFVENNKVEEPVTTQDIHQEFENTNVTETAHNQDSKVVLVNGERNRILFEGEEDFLNENQPEEILSDAAPETNLTESAKENSTEIIEETIQTPEVVYEEEKVVEIENRNTETVTEKSDNEIQNTEISEQFESENSEENSSDLSFHGIETFMPNVAVPVENKIENYLPKQAVSRHEEEMKRLIEEVEAKIKAKKQAQQTENKIVEDDAPSDEISFLETQGFDLKKIEDAAAEEPQLKEQTAEQKPDVQIQESVKEEVAAQNSSWKPMSLASNTPDALIQKTEKSVEISKSEVSSPEEKNDIPHSTKEEKVEEIKSEERPVFNVSFFAPNVSKIDEEKQEKEGTQKVKEEESSDDSNVPQFINTWQNWLKIDRKEPETSTEEIKEKAIEKFIENEPKISKLKDETSFVVKEKADDISHLMTETLAKLYVEQRLYSKAIKAYETLQKKHPEKTDYFADKINEVKDLRTNK